MLCYLLAGSRLVLLILLVCCAVCLTCGLSWLMVCWGWCGCLVWVVEFGYLFVMGFVVVGGCLLWVWCGDCLLV